MPAGLEYLGCGAPGGTGTDHTTEAIATNPGSAEEYPGSGPISVESLAECVTPELVETEELDPDGPGGPMSFGVYTHVRWDVGTLTAGQVKTFKYRAAVPIRANVLAFTGGTKPTGASGEQAVNLDNNTGAEVVDETPLPTFATAAGTYQGGTPVPTSDETILNRTAEDWAVHKSVEAARLEQGQNVKWNLLFETSEYKYVKDGLVTDTLPNGLCPLGPENFTSGNDPADVECDPVVGKEPSAPYTSAVDNANGSWTLTWDAADFTALQHTAINDKFTLSFWTHTRTHYQENGVPTTPVLSHDRISNGVTTEAEGFARCIAPEATNCENPAAKISHLVADGTKISDASSAELEAEGPTLEKWVSSSSPDCATATYVKAPTVPVYHPGDTVCWKLRITFPGTLDTNAQTIADFLPPGAEYVAGSDEPHGDNNVEATLDASGAGEGVLTWTAENSTVPAGGEIFERVIATKVAPVGNVVNGDLKGNLLKFSSANTPGESEALRAEANYEITTPVLALTKGVAKIAGQPPAGNDPDVDGGLAHEGQTVEYRIDVKNEGGAPAKNTVVWDQLEDGITCADFKIASDLGGCNSGAKRVEWSYEPNIAPGETHTFNYVVEIPAGFEPGKKIDDHAGVVSYQSETNEEPLPGLFTYTPADNINPGAPTPNAPAADDTSFVETPGVTFLKDRVTAVTEPGNNELTQATIGEEITYVSTFTLPEGTTLYAGSFKDILGNARFAELIDTEAKMNGGALPSPSSVTADSLNIGLEVSLPPAYTNPAGSGDDHFEFVIKARVADTAANSRVAPKQTLTNIAEMTWNDQGGAPHGQAASVDTEIVEPNIGIAKTDDDADKRVSPGQVIEYTVTTTNKTGTRVSTAHDVETFDQLPDGLILLGAGTEPLADGAEVPGSGGATWNATTRTITKKVATLAPGQSNVFKYRAEVEDPAVAGSVLTNPASTKTASLAEGTSPIRRTTGSGYSANAEDTVRLVGAAIEKTTTPGKGTPGDPLTYHLKVTIPASVNLFDTTVRDVLPAGLDFDGFGEEKCLSGCGTAIPIQHYKPAINGSNGKETIAWDLGDIAALAEPQVLEFTYDAHIRATNRVVGGNVVNGNTLVNAATVSSNLTNKGGFDEDEIPTSFDETSPEAKTTTTVIEPTLTLDKQIKVGSGSFGNGPTTAHSNDPLAYRLIVENNGTSPAYNAEITDALDPALTDVDVVTQPGLNVIAPWSEATHSMTLEIEGPIPAGGSVTVEYTASFVEPAQLHDGQQVPNTAGLPKYFGVPKVERDANPTWEFRQYADGSDSVEAVLDFPTFAVVKTTGLAGNPDSGNAEINQPFPWRIVASNTSATAGATNVVVADRLPANWDYVPGTAEFDGVSAPDPAVAEAASGDELEWTLPSLAAGASTTITFSAKPSLAAATTPGTGPEANINSALITAATDEAGNTGNEEGAYRTPADPAKATLQLPDLEVKKTPDNGAAVAGEPSSFTVEVTNKGTGIARNLVVEDVMMAGLEYAAESATANPSTGFSEASSNSSPFGAEAVWHIDSLGAGAKVTITVPVTVLPGIPDGQELFNGVDVTSDEVTTPVHDDGKVTVGTEADMAIEKSGDATYTAGDEYTWHLRVKNLGPSDAQGVEVKDPLPAGTSVVSASSPCAESGGEVKCVIGKAVAGFDQSYDVTVAVDPGTTTAPLDNTATVSSTTTDPNPSNDSSTFGPTPSPLADAWVEKTAAPDVILETEETEFTIEVGNDGPSRARAVKVTDPVTSEGLEYVSTEAPCTETGGTVTCEFGDLAPGETRIVKVKAKGIKDGGWENTATVSTTTPEPPGPEAEENNHSTAEVVVGKLVDLAIEKTGPATVAAGGQITWTLNVSNEGPDKATAVKVEDALPAGVQFVSADPGCTEASGKVTCELGDLALGESTQRQITVTAPTAQADQTLVNNATVKAEEGELEKENNHAEAKTTVGPAADLAITKTGPAKVTADGDVTWTVTATNNGPSTATGVKVEDTLPGGVELRSSHPSQGSCSGSLGCSLGTLAKGASAQIEVTAHVPASLGGQKLTNRAKVSGEEPDPNPSNNSAEATTEVDPKPSTPPANVAPTGFNLTLEKKLERPSRPQRGDVLTYDLTVANQGPATANQVKITDDLPNALEYVSASIPGGDCSAKGAVVTCKLDSLAAGAKKAATLKARAVGTGRIKNTASVSAAGAERTAADNLDGAVANISAGGTVLKLTKKRLGPGLVEAGKKVKFRIKVKNRGRVAAKDVVVCDRLPNAMSFVKVRKAKFKRGDACWTIAKLGPRRSRGFTVVARIDGGVGDTKLRNVAELEAENAPDRRAAAPVRVKSSGPGREGGVTG